MLKIYNIISIAFLATTNYNILYKSIIERVYKMDRCYFLMKHSLGGGFGGTENCDWEKCYSYTEDGANKEAYEAACEDYESYAGHHGLRDTDSIMEEDGVEYEEAEEIYNEEREGWLDYDIKEVSKEVWESDDFEDIKE